MRTRTFHGFPPTEVPERAERLRPGQSLPFYGIVPRALIPEVRQSLGLAEWLTLAAELEQWGGCAELEEASSDRRPILRQWAARYAELDVVSWHGSRNACVRYLRRALTESDSRDLLSDYLRCPADELMSSDWDLWQVKEGHTTSVWRATPLGYTGEKALCINLARDRAASLELMETVELLRGWHANDFEHVVPILRSDLAEVREGHRGFGLAAMLSPWIPGCELHCRFAGDGSAPVLLEVEAFLGSGPAGQRILGRALSAAERTAVLAQWKAFLVRHGQWCPGRPTALIPDLRVNEGDLVLSRDGTPIVVACGAGPLPVPWPAWEAFLAESDPVHAFSRWHGDVLEAAS